MSVHTQRKIALCPQTPQNLPTVAAYIPNMYFSEPLRADDF